LPAQSNTDSETLLHATQTLDVYQISVRIYLKTGIGASILLYLKNEYYEAVWKPYLQL